MLGKQAVPVLREDGIEIWAKEMEDGSIAVGIFNTGFGGIDDPVKLFSWDDFDPSKKAIVDLSILGLSGSHTVRDLWRQKDLGTFSDTFETEVPHHGVILVKISSE